MEEEGYVGVNGTNSGHPGSDGNTTYYDSSYLHPGGIVLNQTVISY